MDRSEKLKNDIFFKQNKNQFKIVKAPLHFMTQLQIVNEQFLNNSFKGS